MSSYGTQVTWIICCFNEEEFVDDPGEGPSNANSKEERKKRCEDWLTRFAPKTPSELFLHKLKVDQINRWLQHSTRYSWEGGGLETSKENTSEIPILVMVGPSGSGKTTAFKILAAAQDFDVIEWITPVDVETFESGQPRLLESQVKKFEDFLMNAGRYPSLWGEGKKRVVFVKDFPNIFVSQPTALYDILRRYQSCGKCPLVLQISEQVEGLNRMFSRGVIDELKIEKISFNKAPNSTILKILRRVCALNEDLRPPPDPVLQEIVETSQGDIRNAVLQLMYGFTKDALEALPPPRIPKKRKKKEPKRTTKIFTGRGAISPGACPRDVQLSIFQRVGRVLYPKKLLEYPDGPQLAHDPEEIVGQTISHPRRFTQMIHENYLKIFHDMTAIQRAIRYASDTDTMMAKFEERDTTLPIALSTITRGFMTCGENTKRFWNPLTNREHTTLRKRTEMLRKHIMENDDPKFFLHPRDAAMDILPMTCPEFMYLHEDCLQYEKESSGTTSEDEETIPEINMKPSKRGPSSPEVMLKSSLPLKPVPSDEERNKLVQEDSPYEIESCTSEDENGVPKVKSKEKMKEKDLVKRFKGLSEIKIKAEPNLSPDSEEDVDGDLKTIDELMYCKNETESGSNMPQLGGVQET